MSGQSSCAHYGSSPGPGKPIRDAGPRGRPAHADGLAMGGGWLAGHFMKRGWTTNRARKTAMFIFAACVFPVAFATISDKIWISAALIAIAGAAHQAWSANLFSLASDMFPRRVVASVTGLGGMAGSLGGIALFLIVGWLKDHRVSYIPIFIAAAVGYLLALAIIQLLVPKLEPANVDLPPPK